MFLFHFYLVSAICLSMPDALQKLHESSKFQEQNQTAISQKIYEIQQRIENFEKEVSLPIPSSEQFAIFNFNFFFFRFCS